MKNVIQAVFLILSIGLVSACSEPEVSKGDQLFNRGDFDLAIAEYTDKLKYSPNDVRVLYNRGRAYEEKGEFELAKEDFDEALDLDPNNFQVLLTLANLHHKEKNFTNALLYSNRAAEIPGAPAMASFMKGRALHQLGDTEEALKAYGNAIKMDKEYGQAYYNRGLLKIAVNRVGTACEDFQLARALEYPGSQEAFTKYCR